MRLTGVATIAWRLGPDSCSTCRFLITQLDPLARPAFRLSPVTHRRGSTTCCLGTHPGDEKPSSIIVWSSKTRKKLTAAMAKWAVRGDETVYIAL
jgi:hypothetical protein